MHKKYFIHESSFIDDNAKIGENTKIWHFCHISKNSTIGSNCSFGQNVFLGKNVKIGDKVKIQNNVSVYEGVELEDGVFCGPSMVFTNDSNPRSEFPKNGAYKKTLVKKGASIGANATIVCGIEIGQYAFIGAGALVNKNVPNFALVYGVPAKHKGWICKCGEKLNFVEKSTSCSKCKIKYNKLSENKIQQLCNS
ncbi:MAG: acyltransferase [bacterium]|nr:acyltransferase [bacterium]